MNKGTKKRYLLIISTLFAATLGGAVLAGCANRKRLTLEKVTDNGFTCIVTFNTADGVWATGKTGGSTTEEDHEQETEAPTKMEERKMYLKPGSLLNQAAAEAFAETVREGYTFNNYCTASTDEAGNVTYEPWDYTKPVTESMTLYARWMENYTLVAHYGSKADWEKGEEGIKGIPTKTFTVPQNREGVAQPITSMNFTQEDVTILAMYEMDQKTYELTTEFTVSNTSPYTAPCTAENKEHHVFVETIDGSWTLVRTKKDFNIYTGSWLYLLTDIDFGGEELTFPTTFFGKLHGNNHTVSNFKVKQRAADRNDRYFGLFKEIRNRTDEENKVLSHAEIKDITFADVTYTADMWNPQVLEYNAGIFAGRVAEETVIENVTLTGTFKFAITVKGRNEGDNYFESTKVDWAIGYRFLDVLGNEQVDMSKYQVNLDGVQVEKYENESLEKDEYEYVIFPEKPLPPSDEDSGEGADE